LYGVYLEHPLCVYCNVVPVGLHPLLHSLPYPYLLVPCDTIPGLQASLIETQGCNRNHASASADTFVQSQMYHYVYRHMSGRCDFLRLYMYIGVPKRRNGSSLFSFITKFILITFTFHFIPFTLSLSTFTSSTSTRTSYLCYLTSKGHRESPRRTVLRQLQRIRL
jgi:hypothetical protein